VKGDQLPHLPPRRVDGAPAGTARVVALSIQHFLHYIFPLFLQLLAYLGTREEDGDSFLFIVEVAKLTGAVTLQNKQQILY
jgi:hypothetical protein